MDCPNGCGTLTDSSAKDVEFCSGDSEIELTIHLTWCTECRYVQEVNT